MGSASTQSLERLPLTRALGWLAETPPAVRFGLKYGTAMAASIWIAFASGLDWGLTIWITVMFVAQPNTGASIKKGLMRIWGSAASGLVSIAIYGLFAQQPALMLASICGAFALAVYGMTGPRYPYAWLVFGFTTSLILAKAMAGSDQIETLSFERSTLTALGVLIVFVADSLFWPVRAEEELRKSLAERCRRIGEALKQHLRSPPSERAPDETEPPPSSPLIQQLGLVEQFRDEIGVTPQRVQAFSRIALLLEGLASRTRQLRRYTETDQSAPPLRVALERLGDELNAALAEASHCLAADQAPEPFAEALEHS
ncbi:MAG: FUSC family protein, partial [Deltaproteobacteria bacterium]|nr:FUSC family protein [Deltaproteobacteria bacterium]